MQSVFGMSPIEQAELAADLGCGHISVALGPVPWQLPCFEPWSLRDNPALKKQLISVLRERELTISQGEGFAIRADKEVSDLAADLDLVAELGAEAVSTVCLDENLSRGFDQFALLADLASARALELRLEFAPPHPVNTLDKAFNFVRRVNSDKVKLVIDTMHFFRCGHTLSELGAIDPSVIGYIQLSDATVTPQVENYFKEACFQRLLPGDGEMPLAAFLGAIPESIKIGLEIPVASRAESYADIKALMSTAVERATALIHKA